MPDVHPTFEIDAHRLLGVLWKRRRWIIAGAVLGFGFGMLELMRRTPVYRATARMLVERQGPKLLKFNDSDGWIYPQDVPFDTHASLIRTPPIAVRVAKTPAVAQHPALAALAASGGESTDGVPNAMVDALLAGLDTRPSQGEFGIIDIVYVSPDPDLAVTLANAFADEYIQDRVEAGLGLTKTVSTWVDARLREHEEKLTAAEQELQEFRETWQFVGPREDSSDRLGELLSEVDAAARAREDAERQRDQIRRTREASADVGALAEVAGNAMYRELTAERARIAAAIAEASTALGPKHPEMRKLTTRQAEVESLLTLEVDRILLGTDLEVERLQAREAAAIGALRRARGEALVEYRRGTDFARLEREVELNRQIYDALLRRLKSLGLSMDAGGSEIRVVARARRPGAPYAGRSLGALLQAVAAGLLFATGIAFLWEYLDQTVKTAEELEQQLALPPLGVVPDVGASAGGPGAFALEEAFSAVRSALILSSPKAPPRAVLVTSAGAGEGKSTASFELAAAMARDGLPTLLIDADLRRPVLHARLGVPRVPGLVEMLTSEAPLEALVRATSLPRLWLLPAGSAPPNPSELLGSERMAEILRQARGTYGRIVIDSPPIFAAAETLALADSAVLTTACDGVILVVRARRTTRAAVARAKARLLAVRAKLLGTILNGWTPYGPKRLTGYYYEAYGSSRPPVDPVTAAKASEP